MRSTTLARRPARSSKGPGSPGSGSITGTASVGPLWGQRSHDEPGYKAVTGPVEAASGQRLVSIVAPMFNESATLGEFVTRLARATAALESRYAFEFVLVDDGSVDG